MAVGDHMNTATLTSTFDDEFDTFSASPNGAGTVWQTTLGSGARSLPNNGEQEYYSDSSTGHNPFRSQSGVLEITAQPGSNPFGLAYDSGAINTQKSFSQTYGYFEIDTQMPAGQGLWPAFWLLPESGAWPPELDTFEVLGNDPGTLYFSTHSTVQATQGTTLNVANVSSGFNLYGVMWGPQTVDLYINNVEVASMPTPADMNVAMFMNINLAVGGYWPGYPDGSTPFPAHMLVNSVRAYAYPGTTAEAEVQNTSNGTRAASTPNRVPAATSAANAAAPVVTVPGDPHVAAGTQVAVSGISVADSQSTGALSVVVSDSTGLLNTTATGGVTEQGEGSTSLRLTGSTSAVNAELATLTYTATGLPGSSDLIWVSAKDTTGPQGVGGPIVMTRTAASPSAASPSAASRPSTSTSSATPSVTTPAALTLQSGSTALLSGINVSAGQSGGDLTVMVSDSSGILNIGATNGVTAHGQGSTALTLTGSASAIETSLTSLTYNAANTNSDWLWVSANRSNSSIGPQGQEIGGVAITNTAAASPAPVSTSNTVSLSGAMLGMPDTASFVTATLSDTNGLLAVTAMQGVTVTGQDSNRLTLQGTVNAINAELGSLTYSGGSDFWVSGSTDNLNIGVVGSSGATLSSVMLPVYSGHLATWTS
jgi:beta-glucanase (GH16 family)